MRNYPRFQQGKVVILRHRNNPQRDRRLVEERRWSFRFFRWRITFIAERAEKEKP